MDKNALVKYIESQLPAGVNFTIRLPYLETTLEFDRLPKEQFLYLKEHSFCVDNNFDCVEGNEVLDAKLTFAVMGEDKEYVTT